MIDSVTGASYHIGMTGVILSGMKTAVSLPDDLFRRADALAAQLGIPRSQLYARAVSDFLAVHEQAHVTEALNRLYSDEDSTLDNELVRAQADSLADEDW